MVVESGGRRVLLLHGHRFDEFIERYRLTTRLADGAYRLLQWADKSHAVARRAKARSKTFLRCARKVEERAVEYARGKGCDAVCCGHTHLPAAVTAGPVHYFSGGCWTERPCHYIAIRDGAVEVLPFAPDRLSEAELVGAAGSDPPPRGSCFAAGQPCARRSGTPRLSRRPRAR